MSDTRKRAASLPTATSVTRRSIFLAAGGAAVLAACGDDDEGGGARTGGQTSAPAEPDEPTSSSTTPDDPGSGETGNGGDTGGADAFASVDDVPVGAGAVFPDQEVVVVQPEDGEFKAYAAVCTHQGCPLEEIADGEILCSQTCGHGSRFAIADGSVTQGPASGPLEEVAISVDGNDIALD